MSEHLSAAAEAMGLPEALVQRSAEARAAETGASVDEVLAAWAGGGDVAAAPPEEEAPTAEEAPEEAAVDEEAEVDEEPVAPAAAVVAEGPEERPAATRAPVPDEVTPGEAARLPEVITVPTAGIRERTSFAIPKWLTAIMLAVPLFALFALGGSATGQCGEATELTIDVVSGEIVNCDGSEFTGQAVGGGGTDFIALGGSIYAGDAVTGVNCASCHGANGQGSGTFPALTGVINTFGACGDHIDWVSAGSAGFEAEGRSSYGDTDKPIGGGMPGFAGSLSSEQLAAVTAFERARFGGSDGETVLVECGLVEEAPEEDGEEGDGEGDGEMVPGGETGDEGAEASAPGSG